ncbi:DUF262 domain-containing protein [Streptosporangium sandarakinum]
MKAAPITLGKLLKGEQQYAVPIYQRPYSWAEVHLERLWRDITRQACILGGGGKAGHFLGSIVLAPGADSMPGRTQWVIVDGQQRLTTLFLMLCVIRDHRVAEEDPSHFTRLNNDFLISLGSGDRSVYRLLPTRHDQEDFDSCVVGNPEEARGNIGAAYRFLRRKLARFDGLTSPDDVEYVEKAVLDLLDFVQIILGPGDDAYQVFESINNTGARLSQVDFIRNYVFMCLPRRGAEVYEKHWLPTQRRLGVKEFDRLMHAVHVIAHGEQAEDLVVYRGHQELLEEVRQDEQKVEEYVRDLARRGGYLGKILRPDEKTAMGVSITLLKEFTPATVYPVIMRLLELHDQGHATDEEFHRALQYVESYVVRRFVAQVSAPSLARVLHRLAGLLTEDRPVDETVREELSPIQRGWPSDDEFRRHIAERLFYKRGTHDQRKAVLVRLADSYPVKEPIDLTDKGITIEHILPQNPTQDWFDELRKAGGDPRAVHRRLVHTLGNLTLSGYNSELSHEPFKKKKEILQKSGIAMNQVVAENERWGEAEILNRAADLAERAIKIWPGPDESGWVRGVVPDWSSLTSALAALPPARWISYGDLAELVGSHVLPVRVYLDSMNLPNGHRVLTAEGEPPSEGRAVNRAELRLAMGALESEGVALDELGRARSAHRITARELARLLGREDAEKLNAAVSVRGEHQHIEDDQRRFFQQLGVEAGPQAAGAVQRLLEHWSSVGGEIRYGSGASASCAVVLKRGKERLTALRIRPEKVDVPFRVLMKRHPFNALTVREEFRERLNGAPGVEIPAADLDRQSSFPVVSLAAEGAWDVVVACLDWFRVTAG